MKKEKVRLYDVLKTGYTNDKKKQSETLKHSGYKLDPELSNDNHQVYVGRGNKLIYNVNGTQNTSIKRVVGDWLDNLAIGTGFGHWTPRYREEKNALEKAKKKYAGSETTITGHSKGAYYSSEIADPKKDKVVTFNGAKIGGSRANETNYRVAFDPVSLLTVGQKHTRTISHSPLSDAVNFIKNPLGHANASHGLDNIKKEQIFL